MEERRASTSDPSVIQLGDLFLNMADLFKVYTPYFINHPTAEAVVRELSDSNRLFMEFLNVRLGFYFFIFMVQCTTHILLASTI